MPRLPLPRSRRARFTALAAVVVVLAAVAVIWTTRSPAPPAVPTQDAMIDMPAAPNSAEQVRIDTTTYLPPTLPAPAVLLAHGFGGDKNSVADDARELARKGFVVMTWSARGFGRSTGKIGLNDPDGEVADASRLIDHLVAAHQVTTDANGDPRVAVTGASYGGALSLLLAGTDKRVDAVAPVITYNDLAQGLVPNTASPATPLTATPAAGAFTADGVFKKSWAGIFFSAGSGAASSGSPSAEAPEAGQETDAGATGGTGSAAGAAAALPAAPPGGTGGTGGARGQADPCGRFTPAVCQAYTELATTGKASKATTDLLRRVSPVSVTSRIKVPTLLVQGESDTLFGLDQSDATARQITAAGGKVKTIWYTGGHDGGKPGPQLRAKIADFLWVSLTGDGTDPGTGFAYDVQGTLRANGTPSVRTVTTSTYPGLTGPAAERRLLALAGPAQPVVRPAGANPSAVSGIPGLNGVASSSSRLGALFSNDPPGQAAQFTTTPVDSQIVISGASTVRLQVAADPARPQSEAVLFAKLYDVGQDGSRVLPANAVAPFRVSGLPADGTPVQVTVTLPGIVRPIEGGHSLRLVVGTTDQAFAAPVTPAVFRIGLAAGTALAVPIVPGKAVGSPAPVGQIVGIAVTLVLGLAVVAFAAIRRRRDHDFDPELAQIPLVIDGLSKQYPGGFLAVDDLTFRVEAGQVLGLLGPNGAGKTTTLRILMGLLSPTSGSIRVFGHKVTPGAPVLSRIGSFVEGAGFLPHLSGRANLELYWASTGRPAEKAYFSEALEIAGLGDSIDRRVKTYSQGMRQRLAIAQAMLGLPELMVLDEPTNGLDPPQIHQMREVLQRYARTGRTVLVSSHLLAEVEQTCTHVVVMHRGALVASGEVGEVAAGNGEATFRVDDPAAAAATLKAVSGVTGVDVDGDLVHANLDGMPRAEAVATLVRAGVAVEQAGPRRRLEDAFLQLVGDNS